MYTKVRNTKEGYCEKSYFFIFVRTDGIFGGGIRIFRFVVGRESRLFAL